MKSSKPRSFWRNYIFDYGVILLLFRLKVYDEYNDEEVEVTKKELKLINRLLKGKAPHSDFDPYAVCSCHLFCSLISDGCQYWLLTNDILNFMLEV